MRRVNKSEKKVILTLEDLEVGFLYEDSDGDVSICTDRTSSGLARLVILTSESAKIGLDYQPDPKEKFIKVEAELHVL